MEKLEHENVSLDFQVQSLIKECDNVKAEYQRLFDSIKKTRSQTQKEIDELIAHVSEKTYTYGAIRAKNQNLLFIISELKTRLKNVKKGKSVNTKFDTTNGSQTPLCVTPIKKHAFQKKTNVSKIEGNHVVSKPVTLQTSPDKQSKANSSKNVIAPGMYKVVTSQESQTHNVKSGLSSTGMNAASSVRRSMNRDSHDKNIVLANSKNLAKKVAVYVRKNKQTDNISANVISNKENVIDVDVANASKAKNLLCFSCMQNVLILCHDKCLANHRLNMHSNARRTLSTKSRTPKSSDTTYVVLKTSCSSEKPFVSVKKWVVEFPIYPYVVSPCVTDLTWLMVFQSSNMKKDHLCSACERGKSKKASHPPNLVSSDNSKLELLHMDLCGPMRIMETIHVKFDELTAMASEHDSLEPELQRFNNHNSSAEPMNTTSKEDLDNLFGLMFEEYFGKKSSDTPINFAAQPTQLHEDSPSTTSITIDENEAPLIETTSDEQTSPISLTEADELHQEDSADFDGN
nr:integrase, catalytic region, zinc finger, CCHC-type, peptidase aspartic, catalytic [Tanacetum cinerariifolium]